MFTKKKIYYLGVIAFLCTCVSCSREIIYDKADDESPTLTARTLTATITQPDSDTKVAIASSGAFTWTSGDKIAVHSTSGVYYTAELQSGEDTSTGTFSLEMSGSQDNFAIYPASIVDPSNYTSSSLKVVLPSSYTIGGTMGNDSPLPMIATNSGSSLTFNHLGGLFRITLKDLPASTSYVKISTDATLSGTLTVSNVSSNYQITATNGSTSNTITYYFASATSSVSDVVVNLPVPVGTLHTLTACAYNSSSQLISKGYNDLPRTVGRANGRKITVDMAAGTYLFDGYRIAPGNLFYTSSGFDVAPSWEYGATSFNSTRGRTAGSYFFNWYDASHAFSSTAYSSEGDNIFDNVATGAPCYYGTGWLMVNDSNNSGSYPSTSPSTTTWARILSTGTGTRNGSTVNEVANRHYARVKLSDFTYSGNDTPRGLLIFPDNKTITGQFLVSTDAWSGDESESNTTTLTKSQLQVYIDQGCAFLPAAGAYNNAWYYGGTLGYYWSGSTYSSITTHRAYYLYFDSDGLWNTSLNSDKSKTYFSVRPVR